MPTLKDLLLTSESLDERCRDLLRWIRRRGAHLPIQTTEPLLAVTEDGLLCEVYEGIVRVYRCTPLMDLYLESQP